MTDNLVFEITVDPEVIKYTYLENSQSWKGKLTPKDHVDTEWYMASESAKCNQEGDNLGHYHFVLRDKSIKTEDPLEDIVAACQTLNRAGWRIEPNGELQDIIAPCVGAVYTGTDHRGKGYAATMISQLNRYWDTRLGEKGYMFLYSAVGDYYNRVGYESREIRTHNLTKLYEYVSLNVPMGDYKFLMNGEYSDLVDVQKAAMKNYLIEKSKTTDKTLYTLVPNVDTYLWYQSRDMFTASKVRPDIKIIHFGAVLTDGSHDSIVWFHNWHNDALTILELGSSSHESFKKLIDLAIIEARKFDLKGVHLWHSALGENDHLDVDVEYLGTLPGSKLFQENDARSMIRPMDGEKSDSFSWVFNEKWAWF
jgi:hypothetical protein